MKDIKRNGITGMFEGKILPVTLKLAMPMFISNLLSFLYMIVDTYFISLIDKTSTALLSGPALIFPIFFIFLSLAIGLTTGISSLVARAIGENNHEAVDNSADSGLLIALIIALFTIIAGYMFGDRIISMLAGSKLSDDAVQYALEYFYYIIPGLGLLLFGYVLVGVLQGEGLTKYIAIMSITSCLFNIILDPILIFGFDMGVKGAALATTISYCLAGVYGASIFITKKSSIPIHWNFFKAKKKIMSEIIRIGSLESLGMLSISITIMVLNNLISSIGETEMNSWAICGRTDQFLLIPAFSVAGATITMIGQNYGRKNLQRIYDIYKTNIRFSLTLIFSLAVIYTLTAPFLIQSFSDVKDVIDGSVFQIRILSFTFLGISNNAISASSFQALGHPIQALFLRIIRVGIFLIPISYISVNVFNQGMYAIFTAIGIANVMMFFISWIWTKYHIKHLSNKDVA